MACWAKRGYFITYLFCPLLTLPSSLSLHLLVSLSFVVIFTTDLTTSPFSQSFGCLYLIFHQTSSLFSKVLGEKSKLPWRERWMMKELMQGWCDYCTVVRKHGHGSFMPNMVFTPIAFPYLYCWMRMPVFSQTYVTILILKISSPPFISFFSFPVLPRPLNILLFYLLIFIFIYLLLSQLYINLRVSTNCSHPFSL